MSDQPKKCWGCEAQGGFGIVIPEDHTCEKTVQPPVPESWEKEFDALFGDEIVERVQEYCYTEKYEKPLKVAQTFVQNIKAFIYRLDNQTLEEAAEAINKELILENNTYVGDEATGYFACREDAVTTIRSLKK